MQERTAELCVMLVLLIGACAHTAEGPAADTPALPPQSPLGVGYDGGSAPPTSAPGEAFSEEEFADVVVRILAARRDKSDAAPLVEALACGLPRVELYVLGEFARMGPAAAGHREQVEQLLKRSEESVRAAAARALGRMGEAGSVPCLLDVLAGDSSATVRAASAEALGALREPAAGEALVTALDDAAPEVRQAAVLALAQVKWGPAGSALVGRLAADGDIRVRELAAYALGELGGTQWVSALAQALAGDDSPRVRLNAAEALGKVEARGELEVLVAALRDPDVHVRESVVVALGRVGDLGVIQALENFLEQARRAGLDQLATTTWQTLLKLASVERQALWELAMSRYRLSDHGRAQEACQRLIEEFGSTSGTGEVWSGRVLLGVMACERGNCDQAESLLRQAVSDLEQGDVPAARSTEMVALLGVNTSLKEVLMDRLAGALASGGRGQSALEIWDELDVEHPELSEHWWLCRYTLLKQMAQAGAWATVDLYFKGASFADPDYGGAHHDELQALAQEATDVLNGMSVAELVDLWLPAPDDVAAGLEPRIRAKGREALPPLIDALNRQEAGARRRAIVLLRALTDQGFGFEPDADAEARAAAVGRWRDWLVKQSQAPAVDAPATLPQGPETSTESQTTHSNPEE